MRIVKNDINAIVASTIAAKFDLVNFQDTHQFDLFRTSTHRLYFDLNLYLSCTSRPIRN